MPKPIVIASGGTGGHLFPAQALAQQLKRISPETKVIFMGGGLASNLFFDRASFTYEEIPSATFQGKNPLSLLRAASKISRGVWQAWRALRRHRPQVVVGFGGYPSLPVLVAAKLLAIPIVLHEGNAAPGKVIRLFSRWAALTGVQIPRAAEKLQGKCMEVPLPLREGFTPLFASKEKARQYYQLDPHQLTILVFGGSQGALSVNIAVCAATAHHLAERTKNFQVIHLTGDLQVSHELTRQYEEAGISFVVKSFEPRMEMAWMAADLVIGRAGASSIAEQIEFEKPGILLPYPHATDHHQEYNAQFMEETVQGGWNLGEGQVDATMLASLMMDLVGNEQKQLKEMEANLQRYKKERVSPDLASVVLEVARVRG